MTAPARPFQYSQVMSASIPQDRGLRKRASAGCPGTLFREGETPFPGTVFRMDFMGDKEPTMANRPPSITHDMHDQSGICSTVRMSWRDARHRRLHVAAFHVTLHETCSVACGLLAWVLALHVMGSPYLRRGKCPCHMPCGWPDALMLVQDLIY